MMFVALRALASLVGRLPSAARSWLGAALGFLAGRVLGIRRALVQAAMDRANVRDPSGAAARMYRDLGHGVVELLWLSRASAAAREACVARVELDAAAVKELDAAVRSGPVILFASHTGNWELAAAAAARLLASRGRTLSVVAKAMHARGVDAFVSRVRRRLGVRVVPPRGAFQAARRLLASGGVVVMPIDQVPDRAAHGVPVRFLREMALADRAPATLAWRARATVLVVAAERTDAGHRVRLLETIAPAPPGARARTWIAEATERATAALEAFIADRPESWLWLHRRWRAPRRRATRRPEHRRDVAASGT